VRAILRPAPWYEGVATAELLEAVDLLDGVWRVAAGEFYADRQAKVALGKPAPKGSQRFLNRAIEQRFEAAGWDVHGGRFTKGRTWVRVTFRHQMSLGSDLLDALKVAVKTDAEQVAIMAASADALATISPNDQHALTSYEKLSAAVHDLTGCLDIPLVLGQLILRSPLPADVARVVLGDRPRDTYTPPAGRQPG
jgi:hypothetical protein